MGIPKFFSWLVTKYPQITAAIDNKIKFDNLYLDMNEILYNVLHPTSDFSPVTIDQVFSGVQSYLDAIFAIVKPGKLVFMAFDGVAPRAKYNELRSRRFTSAKDAADAAVAEENLRTEFESAGKKLPPKNFMGVYFSHCVAPGTDFMVNLRDYLKNYVSNKLKNNPEWGCVKVVLSDANVPGEGEHKIMSFVRQLKKFPGYNKKTSHCVYGSDSDLIMLSLATHEDKFFILRSSVFMNERKFQFVNLSILRGFITKEVKTYSRSGHDLDSRIDDFICMCLLLGNDFLPAIPSLCISEGAIDFLLKLYKSDIVYNGEYLTKGGRPDLKILEKFVRLISVYEEDLLKKRAIEFNQQLNQFTNTAQGYGRAALSYNNHCHSRNQIGNNDVRYENKNEMKKRLKELVQQKKDTFSHGYKRKEDKVKFGESGWKTRYYMEKFSVTTVERIEVVKKEVVRKYIEGLCWIMEYYFHGIGSWNWYYPYHYAPFASDLKDFRDWNVSFELGVPLKPFTQMLAVSPIAYSQSLPKEYKNLMVNQKSTIKDWYPTDFEVDTDGKRYIWEGIVKLPFVNEECLLKEVAKIEDSLTGADKLLNTLTSELIFNSSKVGIDMNGLISPCRNISLQFNNNLVPNCNIQLY